ncbi:response regulator transcription factor [Flavobacterium sp. NRK F10]|uniref:response regulator transcription factor n=1 Tax=Flavobacterium sp. NRK F10 TaxID=2954931 RepID=UPI0020905AA0|nr:response regulator transcription factor [Flavobacterium sp. NRK F10]MCO6175354.1 response regulator transcription factor [Flavobacterium sp. NRK F10]
MRIAIVDDHQLFRKSLAHLVDSFQDVDVVLQAGNGKEFLEQIDSVPIDLVLLDIQMPELDGFQTCKVLREEYPDMFILIISQLTTKESVHKVMELGAHGFFTKNSDPNQLEQAINSIKEKGYYFGNELGTVLREALLWEKKANQSTTHYEDAIQLTSREIEIIKLASRELSSKEMGKILNIASTTVDTHRKHIIGKTNSKNIVGAVIYALKRNLIQLDDI